jgi:hypothetical protein
MIVDASAYWVSIKYASHLHEYFDHRMADFSSQTATPKLCGWRSRSWVSDEACHGPLIAPTAVNLTTLDPTMDAAACPKHETRRFV